MKTPCFAKKIIVLFVMLALQRETKAGVVALGCYTWTTGNNHTLGLVQLDSYASWHAARLFAEEFDQTSRNYLASFTSEPEWTAIRDNFLKPNRAESDQAWLDATDQLVEGQWRWVTREAFSYTGPANPDNLENEDYLVAWRFGPNDPLQWNDKNETKSSSNYLLLKMKKPTAVLRLSTVTIGMGLQIALLSIWKIQQRLIS